MNGLTPAARERSRLVRGEHHHRPVRVRVSGHLLTADRVDSRRIPIVGAGATLILVGPGRSAPPASVVLVVPALTARTGRRLEGAQKGDEVDHLLDGHRVVVRLDHLVP